jgi:hypothetical protein
MSEKKYLMKKPKILMPKIGIFFREVAAVVLGVAITLSVGVWINNRSVKRDVALSLNAIKVELERNAIAFENYAKRLNRSTKYCNYVLSNDENSISQDSIRYYSNTDDDGIGWGDVTAVTVLIKNAFEMLKTSGIMRHISDKELLENIWEIYSKMENVQKFLDDAFQVKKELAITELQTQKGKGNATIPMLVFYSLSASYWMEWFCRDMSEEIKKVLSEWE